MNTVFEIRVTDPACSSTGTHIGLFNMSKVGKGQGQGQGQGK